MSSLAIGAGAAAGLETLMARLRAEEELSQHQQQLEQQRQYQNKTLDLQSREQADREANTGLNRQLLQIRMDALKKAFEPDDTEELDHSVVPGSSEDVSRGLMRRIGAGPGAAPASSPTSSPEGRGTTQQRLGLAVGGINPNSVLGSIPAPRAPKGPEDLSAEETYYTGIAKRKGFPGYKEWAAADPDGLAAAKHEWEKNSRIMSPAQVAPPGVFVMDPNNPNMTVFTPRDKAYGQPGPLIGGQRDRVAAYEASIALVEEIKKLGEKVGWKGLGPVSARVGSAAMEFLGKGNPEEEMLRNKIASLKAAASFQEGGKAFTGTERELLEEFLANVRQNPRAVQTRLDSFLESARRSRASLVGEGAPPPAASPTGQGGGGSVAAPPSDMYNRYLERQRQRQSAPKK